MTLTEVATSGAAIIELLAACVIVFHAVRALIDLIRHRDVDAARLLIAEGVLAALGFSLAATLLKVIGLQQWVQIRTFATVFVLRTVLKKVFQHESNNLGRRTEITLLRERVQREALDRVRRLEGDGSC